MYEYIVINEGTAWSLAKEINSLAKENYQVSHMTESAAYEPGHGIVWNFTALMRRDKYSEISQHSKPQAELEAMR